MKRTTNWYARLASVIAPCCLALLFGAAREAAGAEQHREPDFDVAKGVYLYNQGRYAEAERHLKEA